MTDPNWGIPGAQAYLSKPTAAREAQAARQRTALGSAEEVRAQREQQVGVLRARHTAMLERATDPILRALVEAHGPSGTSQLWPTCSECPEVPDEYGSEPESWPCGVWWFISDRMEEDT